MEDSFLSKSIQLVDINALDGVVTLSGFVSSDVESRVLEKKVKTIEGVKKTENKLTNRAPELTCLAQQPSSLSEPIDQQGQTINSDWQLALSIYQILLGDNFFSKSIQFVDVNAKEGVVTLSGIVSNKIEAQLLEKKVKTIEGVKMVENKITVR